MGILFWSYFSVVFVFFFNILNFGIWKWLFMMFRCLRSFLLLRRLIFGFRCEILLFVVLIIFRFVIVFGVNLIRWLFEIRRMVRDGKVLCSFVGRVLRWLNDMLSFFRVGVWRCFVKGLRLVMWFVVRFNFCKVFSLRFLER